MWFPPIDAIGKPIDFLFPVRGDCVFAGYNYPLYAALKTLRYELFTDPEIHIGCLDGVTPTRRGLLLITHRTTLRVRAPHYFASGLVDQCERPIQVGSHIIRLGLPRLLPIRPARQLWAEFVSLKSMSFKRGDRNPSHAEFLGWFSDKLTRKIKACTTTITVGRARQMPMGEHPTTKGYAIQVDGLTNEQSMQLQIEGMGGRRHMGGGLFIPGRMPAWLRSDDTRFAARPRKRRRTCSTLAI